MRAAIGVVIALLFVLQVRAGDTAFLEEFKQIKQKRTAEGVDLSERAADDHPCQFRHRYTYDQSSGKCLKLVGSVCARGRNSFFNKDHCVKACIKSNPPLDDCKVPMKSLGCVKYYCDSTKICQECPPDMYIKDVFGFQSDKACQENC
ncbi:hypothetical protein LSH36_100g03005 [Paralvinella palmiformis]|uniref:BPTI/Kunitz inhibitor domain-containing protein n=1 Tax=Paralvinella palmiformis TaxID=53620 RepID=A0AAD9N9R4_9ANNE|nr:hypothetical protein LSH36_100g03005 [Paralvinella palmiformis]